MNRLISVAAAAELIRQGCPLSLAGPEAALRRLPPGNWIAGTIPYFMTAEGGTVAEDDQVFATDLSTWGEVQVRWFSAAELPQVAVQAPDNGFSLLILPAGSMAHRQFAADSANYADAFLKPSVGWVAGVHLSDLGRVQPLVFDGRSGTAQEDGAVVAHVKLPADKLVSLEIVNLFEPEQGDVLSFDDTGFAVRHCRVNGEQVELATYLRARGLEQGRLPLVGDFAGAHLNVSLQSIDADGTVHLYAPVFPGVSYHVAKPVPDYAAAFRARLADVDPQGVVMGCNCILNYLYGELQGKPIGGIEGPVTFGEIAYQLLNQTLVMIRIQ